MTVIPPKDSDFLLDLNEEQNQAVITTEGPVRVVAGPGTGKTRTLTSRYCHLVANLGIAPKNILAVTFTNKAASEMRTRVRESLGDADLGVIATFHSFCRSLLKEEIHLLSYPSDFIITDPTDQKTILKNIFKEMQLTSKDLTIQKALDEILEARKDEALSYIDKFFLLDNEIILEKYQDKSTKQNDKIFLRYLYEQKKNFSLDFNDLINFTIFILEGYEDVRKKWQERFQYVMIDEFQDVSLRQYTLGKILSGFHGNIFIVGDSDQTIYTWRQAHFKMFLNFPKDYSNSQTIVLTSNYRSTKEILDAAQSSIGHNSLRFSKEIVPTCPGGSKPLYFHAPNTLKEGKWVAEKILETLKTNPTLKDIAILCRSHLLAKGLEGPLANASIPFKHINGRTFFARKEIKDALAYLRMLTNADDLAFLRTVRVPSRGIGSKTIARISAFAQGYKISLYEATKELMTRDPDFRKKLFGYIHPLEQLKSELGTINPTDLFQRLLDQTGYEEYMRVSGDDEKLESLAELKRNLYDFTQDPENTLEDFLDMAALASNTDRGDAADYVSIMTIHTAKGLEFETVFVCGLNEGVFPSRLTVTIEDMEEERRIFYVATTRAKKNLYYSSAEGYKVEGASRDPSRFLAEIVDFIETVNPSDRELLLASGKGARGQMATDLENLFAKGDKVLHQQFGPGSILEVKLEEHAYLVQFEALSTPRSITFGSKLTSL
ncbi:MAG: ATP-dependent helicase [Deltaproteobacteria bacterium]|jgi:DNA helicase-2/ATP-dependent DNA helicase PcrA|nr:ATP-dependent helicase [Deltaproteobacteria bacterium]